MGSKPTTVHPQRLAGASPHPSRGNLAAPNRVAAVRVAVPSSIISVTTSRADGGRQDSSKLEPAPTWLIPNGTPLHDEAPANAAVKVAQPKGPLTITSQHVYTSHYGLFLRKTAESADGERFVVFEKLTDGQTKQFIKDTSWANKKYWRMKFIADKLHLPDQKVTILDPKSPFYFNPGATVDPGQAATPWMPADTPEAMSDYAWAKANDTRGYAEYRKQMDQKYAAAGAAAGNGVPTHQQDGGQGNAGGGPDPGGPPAGTNGPDPSGLAGHPSQESGWDSGSNEGPEDMGQMPPAGNTTVEVEYEYGPPPDDAPKSSGGGISDAYYEAFRGCMVYGCPAILNGGNNPGETGGVQGNTSEDSSDSGTSGSSEDDTGSGDDSGNSDDDDEDDDDSSSGSDDGDDSSEGGYTPGADGSGGNSPAGAEELKYSLFQQLGYLFHSRNFGPRFPLVGDPRPEHGGVSGDGSNSTDVTPLVQSPWPGNKKAQPGPGAQVLVNGDLRKKINPAGPDKPTAADGLSDQVLRAFEVIDPVPIEK